MCKQNYHFETIKKIHYKSLIAQAWAFTQHNKRLIVWYGWPTTFISITVGVFYIFYQFMSFRSSHLFLNEDKAFVVQLITGIIQFLKDHPSLLTVSIIIGILFALCYFIIPTFFEAGIIQFIARSHNGQKPRLSDGIGYGFKSFLPLLEYHALMKAFSIVTVITEGAFVLRNFEVDTFKLLMIPMVIIAIMGIIMSLLFTFTNFFIVIDEEEVFKSISKSSSLVLTHWQHTILITILMTIIGVRIFINILIALTIPIIMVLTAGLVATFGIPQVGIFVGIILGLIALIAAAYFGAIIHIFANAVWTITFLELTKEEEVNAREVQSEA